MQRYNIAFLPHDRVFQNAVYSTAQKYFKGLEDEYLLVANALVNFQHPARIANWLPQVVPPFPI
jgi:hypothetical protein